MLFWAPLIENGVKHSTHIQSEFIASEKLLHQVTLQLSEVFNISVDEIPMPEMSVAHGWYAAPYWGGWHVKTGGYHFPTVQSRVLKPVYNQGGTASFICSIIPYSWML